MDGSLRLHLDMQRMALGSGDRSLVKIRRYVPKFVFSCPGSSFRMKAELCRDQVRFLLDVLLG